MSGFLNPPALSATAADARFERKEETYINFAKEQGADRSGVASSLATFNTLVATATPSKPIVIDFPRGKYYFNGAWPTLDPHSVRITGAGADQTELAWGGSFTGTAISWLANPPAPRRGVKPMSGVFISGPNSAATTADCIKLGGTVGAEASLLTFEDVTILGFRDQVTYGSGTYIVTFRDCNFTQWQRNSAVCPSGITGAGEGLKFDNCTFHQGKSGAAIKSSLSSAHWVFTGCHFDYNSWDIDLQSGNMDFIGTYFEATNSEATTTERIKISYLNASSPKASFTNCYIFPLWTMAGTVRQFLRITGTPASNEAWAPNVSFTDPQIYTNPSSDVRRLILDDHTLVSGSSAPKYSRITVRNPNYNDQGNGNGVYRPLVYKDVDNREWLLDPGSDFHPQHSDKKQDWTTTTAHVFETMPKILATEKKQITSGSLYLVRMPWTWNTWRASAYRMTAAIGAAGSADATYARLAIFTGYSNLTNGGFGLATHAGISVNSTPNVPKYADFTSPTFAFDKEQNYYLGLLVIGTTMPEVWGKLTNNSPLTDKGYFTRPLIAGVLPGQTTMPSTIPDLGSVQATDFIPYISIHPTTYA